MKNSKLRRALMLVACAVMLVCLSVGATLAYLTATTGTVNNTFSVGKVSFPPEDDDNVAGGLDEAKVDDQGNGTLVKDADRVLQNSYKLYPDHNYAKDPTIHITKDSDACWVFFTINKTDLSFTRTTTNDDGTTTETTMADIQAGDNAGMTYKTIATQIADNDWLPLTDADGNQVMKDGNAVYYYKNTVTTADDSKKDLWKDNNYIDLVIFEGFSIPATATQETNGVPGTLPIGNEVDQLEISIQAYAAQADGFSTALAAWNACFATANAGGITE